MNIQIDTALAYLVTTNDPALKIIHECIDEDYLQCMKDIQENGNTSHLIKQLKSIKGDIYVLNGLLMIDARRIILPAAPCYAIKLNRDERTENETMLHA